MVNFKSIRLEGLPIGPGSLGWTIASVVDDPSMVTDASGPVTWVIAEGDKEPGAPYGGRKLHRFWPRQRLLRRYVIGPSEGTGQTKASQIAQFRGTGALVDGLYANYKNAWWGGVGVTPPKYEDWYQHHLFPGASGREVPRALAAQYKSELVAVVQSASATGLDFESEGFQRGWFRGISLKDIANGNSVGLFHWDGFQQIDDYNCVLWIRMCYSVQRHALGLSDPLTGIPVTAAQLRASNDVNTNHLPFFEAAREFEDFMNQFPWFLFRDAPHKALGYPPQFPQADPAITQTILDGLSAPRDRSWNIVNAAASFMEDDTVNPWNSTLDFAPGDGTHDPRVASAQESLIFSCGLEIAKWFALHQTAQVERTFSVSDCTYSGGGRTKKSQTLLDHTLVLAADQVPRWGGHTSVGQFGRVAVYSWLRMNGHQFASLATGASLIGPSVPRKAELITWSEWLVRAADWIASPWGSTDRKGFTEPNFGNTNPCDFGPTSYVDRTGARRWKQFLGAGGQEVYDPAFEPGTTYQVYQSAFLQRGVLAVEIALRPRVLASDSNRPSTSLGDPTHIAPTDKPHLRIIDTLTQSVWSAIDDWRRQHGSSAPTTQALEWELNSITGQWELTGESVEVSPDPLLRPIHTVHTVSDESYPLASGSDPLLVAPSARQVTWALPETKNMPADTPTTRYRFVGCDADSTPPPVSIERYANQRCIGMPWMAHMIAVRESRGYAPSFLLWMKRQGGAANTALDAERMSLAAATRAIGLRSTEPGFTGQGDFTPHANSESQMVMAAVGYLQRVLREGMYFPRSSTTGIHPDIDPATLTVHSGGVLPTNVSSYERVRFVGPVVCGHDCEFIDCLFEHPQVVGEVGIVQPAASTGRVKLIRCSFLGMRIGAIVKNCEMERCKFTGASEAAIVVSHASDLVWVRDCLLVVDNATPPLQGRNSAIRVLGSTTTTGGLRVIDSTIIAQQVPGSVAPIHNLHLLTQVGSVEDTIVEGSFLNGGTFSILLEDGGASASGIAGLQLIDNYFGTYPTVGLFHNHNQVPVSQYAHERNLYFPSQLSADPNLVD